MYLLGGRCVPAAVCHATQAFPVGDKAYGRACIELGETCQFEGSAKSCRCPESTTGNSCSKCTFTDEFTGDQGAPVMRCLSGGCPAEQWHLSPGVCQKYRKCTNGRYEQAEFEALDSAGTKCSCDTNDVSAPAGVDKNCNRCLIEKVATESGAWEAVRFEGRAHCKNCRNSAFLLGANESCIPNVPERVHSIELKFGLVAFKMYSASRYTGEFRSPFHCKRENGVARDQTTGKACACVEDGVQPSKSNINECQFSLDPVTGRTQMSATECRDHTYLQTDGSGCAVGCQADQVFYGIAYRGRQCAAESFTCDASSGTRWSIAPAVSTVLPGICTCPVQGATWCTWYVGNSPAVISGSQASSIRALNFIQDSGAERASSPGVSTTLACDGSLLLQGNLCVDTCQPPAVPAEYDVAPAGAAGGNVRAMRCE